MLRELHIFIVCICIIIESLSQTELVDNQPLNPPITVISNFGVGGIDLYCKYSCCFIVLHQSVLIYGLNLIYQRVLELLLQNKSWYYTSPK